MDGLSRHGRALPLPDHGWLTPPAAHRAHFTGGADRPYGTLLDCAQKFRLGFGTHLSDFVEEERAAVGGAEETRIFGISAAERAWFGLKSYKVERRNP
jgi:hypothetical protein